MDLFHIIEDGVVHLRAKGVYREAKVYRRGRGVFAKWGSGFIRLIGGGGTTLSNVSWEAIDAEGVETSPTGGAPVFTGVVPNYVKAA